MNSTNSTPKGISTLSRLLPLFPWSPIAQDRYLHVDNARLTCSGKLSAIHYREDAAVTVLATHGWTVQDTILMRKSDDYAKPHPEDFDYALTSRIHDIGPWWSPDVASQQTIDDEPPRFSCMLTWHDCTSRRFHGSLGPARPTTRSE